MVDAALVTTDDVPHLDVREAAQHLGLHSDGFNVDATVISSRNSIPHSETSLIKSVAPKQQPQSMTEKFENL